MQDLFVQPWPWYVAGPLIGLMVPALLYLTGKNFGISSSLQHLCAATLPGRVAYFDYDWKRTGGWVLVFCLGILLGGFIAGTLLANPDPIQLSPATQADLKVLGLTDLSGLMPSELFSWPGLLTPSGFVMIVGGGFLLGFGARYADGCTSGHAIMGLATFQKASLVAVIGFFIGGLVVTHLLLPFLL